MLPDENLLIQGDNLAVLRAALPQWRDSFRCVYIDPPYNTGTDRASPRAGYQDARSRSEYLDFLRDRLSLLREVLRPDGSLFVQLDDNELDRVKLLLDELMGEENFVSRVTVVARSPSAFSTVNRGVFKATEYLLWYSRDRERFRFNPQRVARSPDPAYRRWLANPEDPCAQWRLVPLRAALPPGADSAAFVVQNAARVCRLAVVNEKKAGKLIAAAKARSLAEPGVVQRVDREGQEPIYLLGGQQLLFYARQVSLIDGQPTASRPLTNLWDDIPWEGIAREGGVQYKQGKKPERLLQRVIQLSTDPGDRVLDAFLGSGTTAAVAHKLGRRWVGIEQGPAFELARERLQRVVDGQDPSGVADDEARAGGFTALKLPFQ